MKYQAINHGTAEGTYAVFGCACAACTGANAFYKTPELFAAMQASLGDVVTTAVDPTVADEPNGTGVTVGGSVTGFIDVTGDTDVYTFSVVAGQTYMVSLRGTGVDALGDTYLELFRPNGNLLVADDDGGTGTNSLLTFAAPTTGTYSIRASAFANEGDPGTGQYTIDVRQMGADAVGATNATAVALNVGTTFGFRETATVSGGADLDRYSVTLEAGKYYTFELAAGADYATDYEAVPAGEIDTILRLRNAAGTLVAQNDDNNFPSDISSSIGFYATTSGTYYLDVTGYAGQTGGYVIDFKPIDYQNLDPLDAIRWKSADNIDTVMVNGQPTAYVYFGAAGETFGESDLPNTHGWNATEKAAVMSALLEYTKITGITYLETADVNQAEFRLQTVSGPNPPVSYGAYFLPQDPSYGTQQGIGVFNINSGGWDKPGASSQDIPGNQVSLNKGGYSYAVILHEFGHAHGLAHPHDRGGGSDIMLGVTGATGSYGIFNLNQGVYTVMSYNDAWDFHPDGPSPFTISGIGQGWSGTLGAFDIAALQERYGVHAYATGNDTYTISSTQAGTYYQTIWDTGGTDAIVYNGTGKATIDLTAATLDYSPTGAGVLSFVDQVPGTAGADGIWGGYTIANGVVIENATGGSGADVLMGNAVVNVLTGNNGDDWLQGLQGGDTLNGGDGNDTASYSYSWFAVTVSLVNNSVSGGAAGDKLISIESVEGSKYGDTLTGNSGDNTLTGREGNDMLDGGGGIDKLYGGDDNDTLDGGNQNDVLDGGAGTDVLRGGNNSDWLNGGTGNDTLTGGNHNDTFAFSNNSGNDTITDFRRTDADKIDLLDIRTTGGASVDFTWVNTAAFSGGNDGVAELRVYKTGTTWYLAGDVNADGAADFTVSTGTTQLISSDVTFA